MAIAKKRTFIIDCHVCKAKVAAIETGRAERFSFDDEASLPYGNRVFIGNCPSCDIILVGESDQIDFENFDAYEDRWSDVVRVFPNPSKSFSSWRIPRVVTDSLNEADRSLQAGANIAACVMLGRALEALCRDVLESKPTETETGTETASPSAKSKKRLMLGEGIKRLRDTKVIDDRLYDWSQQLQAFRNLAAHPEDISISREDAGDLQTFVNAIVEYVYDLADRYDEFKTRALNRAMRKKN
ncbi:DUF4145 domain-containing protein [Duganella sp. BJB476]|uniref:DUF4145 domain-containing protein n=1 Tax=Duganella sp. BJB476 TaxID=1871176 RepID=UPI000E346694|nr:DUF4145 domain-containing protein [Duganella sp. BJB476]RFP29803.1 DUF4145 domain-containing protein [Duganella sp. BJB476]